MTLLVQLPDDLPLIDLHGRGRVLYVFQCADLDRQGCRAFAPDDGGNACFILEPAHQTDRATPAPASKAPIAGGWRVASWQQTEDLNEDPDDVPEGIENGPSSQTKLGGAPFWIQQDETPAGPWRFLFQIETAGRWLSTWKGIAGVGIATVFIRSDGAPEARLLWQCD